jgi:Domain of unknown function (DUF4136)
MSRRVILAGCLGLLVAGLAGATTVKYDFDPEADFTAYQSFAWRDDVPGLPNPFADKRIRAAVAEELTAKGLTGTDRENADLILIYRAAARRELRADSTWYGPRWGRGVRVTSYPVGTLMLDLIDRQRGELVWRGTVSGVVTGDPEKNEKRIRSAIAKLLKKYPPPK